MRFLPILFMLLANCVVAQDAPTETENGQQVEQMFRAIERGDISAVEKMLKNGANPNSKKFSMTAWIFAKQTGFVEIADLLEKNGADPNAKPPLLTEALKQRLGNTINEQTPGYAFLVSRDGKVLAEACFGMANIENKKPIRPEMQFLIGSVSKQFTSTAILLLQEQGKLSVQDKLSKYVDDFHRGDEITLHHLMTHTSGITNYTSNPAFSLTQTMATSEEDLIKSFQHAKLEFEPGEKYSYCNSGYFLLGHIVRKVSGMPLGEYLEQHVFEPLGMKDTGVHNDRWDKPEGATAYRVTPDETTATKTWHMSRAGGAGAMYSNLHDLMLWNEALFNGKVLSESSIKAAMSPTRLNDGSTSSYGYGWFVGEHRGLKAIQHSGGLEGFVSFLIRFPEKNMTVVALHNALPNEGLPSHIEMSYKIADYMLWDEMKPRQVLRVDNSLDPKTFEDYVGFYDYGSPIVMEVSLDDGQLYAQLTGQEKHAIYPQSKDHFFWRVVDAQVKFERDDSGKVVAVTHTQNGSRDRHPKSDKKMVNLSADELDKFVGFYDYGSGMMEVTREGKTLLAQLPGQPALRIFPTEPTVFQWSAVEAKIEFTVDDKGDVVRGKHFQNGRSFDVPRVHPKPATKVEEKKLQDYVGKYNYGFFAGTMTVSAQNGKLLAQLPGQPKMQLIPIADDEFRWRLVNASIKFERNESGKVTHGMHTQRGSTSKVPKTE